MVTDLSQPDHLPDHLEPTGAVQASTCTWQRINPNLYRASCGEGNTWPTYWTKGSWKYCPWCGNRLDIVEAAQ